MAMIMAIPEEIGIYPRQQAPAKAARIIGSQATLDQQPKIDKVTPRAQAVHERLRVPEIGACAEDDRDNRLEGSAGARTRLLPCVRPAPSCREGRSLPGIPGMG